MTIYPVTELFGKPKHPQPTPWRMQRFIDGFFLVDANNVLIDFRVEGERIAEAVNNYERDKNR